MKNAVKTTHKLPYLPKVVSTFAIVLLCSSFCVGALPKTAKLVPSETIVLVDIDNFSLLRAQFEKINLYKLYKDPAMGAFFDDVKTKWEEKKQQADNEIFRIIADAGALPRGRAAIALVLNEQTKDANEPPAVFIIEWGDNIDKARAAVDKIVQKAIEDGSHRKTDEYRGVDITIITDESSETLSYCFIDDCLIGSTNSDILEFVIAHIKGADSPTLADDNDYADTIKTVGSSAGGQIECYVNIKQLIETTIAEDTFGKAKTLIDNLGLNNVISLGCSVDLAGGPGGSSSAKAFLKIDGAKNGICKMLEVESATLRIPQFIPASACSVSFVNLNIKKAFEELANILNSISPQFAVILYMPLMPPGPQGEPALQLKADFIDHLGSQIIIAQSINKSPSNVASQPSRADTQSIVAIAIENRSALEKTLSLLHSKMIAPNNPDASRQLLGHTIYSVDLSAFLPGFGPPPKQPMQASAGPRATKKPPSAFTVTDTHLIFASEPVVEQAIRALSSSDAESVSSAEWFTKAKSNIPSVVGLADLQDNAASVENFWSTMRELMKTDKGKSGDSSAEFSVGINSGSLLPNLILSQGGSELFNFGLLPEFDVVRKYFGLSASYGLSRPDGFFFEFKYLNPNNAE